MPISSHTLTGLTCNHDAPNSSSPCRAAIIERLPYALTYAANLGPRDCAVLFYDNLVAAAEYFCAFIEEGIKRREVTCLTGLQPTLYRTLFEQLGIRVAEFENCGYLRNLSTNDFFDEIERSNSNEYRANTEDALRTDLECCKTGIRFLHIHNTAGGLSNSLQDLMGTERRIHNLSSFPAASICCYDAKMVFDEASPNFFTELLKSHNHCFFQGAALPTSRLLDLQRSTVYPKLKSA